MAKRKLNPITLYEKRQIKEIAKWKGEEPSVVSNALGVILEPLAWLVQRVVPPTAIRAALETANKLGQWMADTGDIMRDGGVNNIKKLRSKDLKISDNLADGVQNWAIGIAVVEGAATGTGGIFTAPLDIPAIITIATRTIHKIGLCYGYECKTKKDADFVMGILAAAGANAMEEKLAALTMLSAIGVTIAKTTWKAMAEKAMTTGMGKEAAIITLRNLAKQLGINLTKRKALAAIPGIGAGIGGTVNGWWIRDVGWAARRTFQERWLLDNNKVIRIDPLSRSI
jgi:uncharacterized protein (DUF697 family)